MESRQEQEAHERQKPVSMQTRELNPQQKQIVDAPINNNLVVIAGAGTGKTSVIVARIKHLLSFPQINPSQILAISFSKDTKQELAARLRRDIGVAADRIQVVTFNSLGWKIVLHNRERAGILPNVRIPAEKDVFRELQELLKQQYKVFILRRLKDDLNTRDLHLLAAIKHQFSDEHIHKAMFDAWESVRSGQRLVSQGPIAIPRIGLEQLAHDWCLLFFPPMRPDLATQLLNFKHIAYHPNYAQSVSVLQSAHTHLMHQVWNSLDKSKSQGFVWADLWKTSLVLNQGALDVTSNCLSELELWFDNKEQLGTNKRQFALSSKRYNFSAQELVGYAIKRKEAGALPRISHDKYVYYKLHFKEAWERYYPCDLERLIQISNNAPEYLKKHLYCPFKKNCNMSLREGQAKDLHASLVNEGQAKDLQASLVNLDKVVSEAQKSEESHQYLMFVANHLDIDQQVALGGSCECSYCPFFLDWYELLFALYEEWREQSNTFDFPEQINRCVRLLSQDDSIRYQVQQSFKYIFVDEFQDTNNMQYAMLFNLKTPPNLATYQQNYVCVVGDDDQAIYGWRGADYHCLERIYTTLGLRKEDLFQLTINYRSHQNVLNLANSLIQNNKYRIIAKRLVCPEAFNYEMNNNNQQIGFDSSSPRVNFVGFSSYVLESLAVGQAVSFLHDTYNVPYNEIAILFRLNFMSAVAEFAMLQQSIPYFTKEASFCSRASVKSALAVLRLALDPTDDEAFILYTMALDSQHGLKHLTNLQKKQKEDKSAQGKVQSLSKLEKDSSADESKNDPSNDKDEQNAISLSQLLHKAEKMEANLKSAKDDPKIDKVEALILKSLEDIKHECTESLYTVACNLCLAAEYVSGTDTSLVNFFKPICARVERLQKWDCSLELHELINSLLEKSEIKQCYNVKEDVESELDMNGKDEVMAIEQLITIASMSEQSETAQEQKFIKAQVEKMVEQEMAKNSAHKKNSKQSSQDHKRSSDGTNEYKDIYQKYKIVSQAYNSSNVADLSSNKQSKSDETNAKVQYSATKAPYDQEKSVTDEHKANANSDSYKYAVYDIGSDSEEAAVLERVHKKVEHEMRRLKHEQLLKDPLAKQEINSYSEVEFANRVKIRNLIFKLIPEVRAPWASALRQVKQQLQTQDTKDKVQLLSIHASKGKEFKAVILLGCENRMMPYAMGEIKDEEQLNEERRLAYVAFTRAKRYLLVTFSKDRMTRSHQIKDTGRSMFVNEATQPWNNCDKNNVPYRFNLVKASDFVDKSNIWEGQIDYIPEPYKY